MFGIDTTTEEGRRQFKEEFDALAEMAPDLVKKEMFVFPHELPAAMPDEPHYRRVVQHYREYVFRSLVDFACKAGKFSEAERAAFDRFVALSNTPALNLFILAHTEKLKHFNGDKDFEAANKVWNALDLNTIEFNKLTAEPVEEQFWRHFDLRFEITDENMRNALPFFCVDPNNRAKVEALLNKQG